MGWLLGCACWSDRVSGWQVNPGKAAFEKIQKIRRDGGLGVGASYIVEDFTAEARTAVSLVVPDPQHPMDVTNPNFHHLKGVMAYGPDAKGRGLKCPRDGKEDCAIVE